MEPQSAGSCHCWVLAFAGDSTTTTFFWLCDLLESGMPCRIELRFNGPGTVSDRIPCRHNE